jgi:hypothetical protein
MNKANTRGEDLDDISMTAQELHVLSELDSRQYGYLLLQLPENEKKRELVLKFFRLLSIYNSWWSKREGNKKFRMKMNPIITNKFRKRSV